MINATALNAVRGWIKMYKSPIDTVISDIVTGEENAVMRAVVKCGINVDKDELVKALAYDRGQYEKGYADAKAELILCKDCIYYDPPHIEHDGQRYEYKDMPPEAFGIDETYVSVAYGINMGGRCCRDYECGYSEDKRVFVPETNYCGRAERKE